MALIENLVVALGLQSAQFNAGMKKAQQDLSGFGKATSALSAGMSGFAGRLLGVAAAYLAITKVIDYLSGSMNRLFSQAMSASKLGASIGDFTGLAFAVGSVGIETEKFDTAMQKMLVTISNAAEGGEKEIAIFNRLGISVGKIKNASFGEQIMLLAAGFDKIQNAAERMDLARGIFGRGGAAMLNVLDGGVAGLNKLIERGKFLGVVIDDKMISKVLNLRQAWFELTQSMQGVWNSALGAIAEYLTIIFRDITNFVAKSRIEMGQIFDDIDFDFVLTGFGLIYSSVMILADAFKVLMYATAAWESILIAATEYLSGGGLAAADYWMNEADKYNKKGEEARKDLMGVLGGSIFDYLRNEIAKLKHSSILGKEGEFIGGGKENLSPGAVLRGSKEAAEAIFKAQGNDINYAQQTVIKLVDLNKAADGIDARLLAMSDALGLDAGIV